jgi:Flp pilus assembly protein TadG
MTGINPMRCLFDRFRRDEGGNVLMLFGLAMVPLIGIMGASVDYAIASQKQTRLQTALDQAGLAVANDPPVSDEAAVSRIKQMMTAQLAANGIGADEWTLTTAQQANNRVSVAATATFNTKLMNLLQIPTMTVAASTEVARTSKLEIALVLDNTGSMELYGSRMASLRTAAKTLVDKLYSTPNATQMVKVALVPFVATVNIKADTGFSMTWIDQNAEAKYHGTNFNTVNGARANHLTLFGNLNVAWKGCVEARAEPYDVDDTPPNPLNPDTLFVPYFWPDEPDPKNSSGNTISYSAGSSYTNNYVADDYTKPSGTADAATASARQKNTTKYNKPHGAFDTVPRDTTGPNKGCGDPITPLTNDAQLMRTRVADMEAWDIAGTNVAQGMVWGWSVLSPTAPFTEGVAYDDLGTQKAMIVLTDGENNVTLAGNHNLSHFSSYGYLAGDRFGTHDQELAIDAIDTKVKALCTKIKAKNIRLYTITFQLNDASAQKMYRECATSSSMYFNSPTTTELEGIFKTIAEDLGNLRFSR